MLRHTTVEDDYCQGVSFAVGNEDALSQAIALVLIQEFKLAKALISDEPTEDDSPPSLESDEIDDIVNRRLRPRDVYHRDGFLFQLMMWLATHLDLEEGDLVALPHSQASGKGQDCIVVHRADDAVVALSICEDKATENPRDTVRDDVWPELKCYELGGRRDELRSNVIATLGLGGVCTDEATKLVRRISWQDARRYRVRVSIDGGRSPGLFKGFDSIVSGELHRRRGETIHLPQLREWMTRLAGKVEANLRSFIKEQ